ncbi:MAG TPA: hypothetical protein VGP47_03125, partial [Parachlamydiaceae bacterium]|nr:hypothetical protein [Parachlamydiaceae bacterium]
MLSISNVFKIPHQGYDVRIPEGVHELLLRLKLVNYSREVEILYRSIEAEKIDSMASDYLALPFARRLKRVLTTDAHCLKENEASNLFKILLGLLNCKGHADLETFACDAYKCFELISCYDNKNSELTLKLPLEIHIQAFEICKNILNNKSESLAVIESILYALPHIINHKDFSPDQQ